jgi:hypothetical protein
MYPEVFIFFNTPSVITQPSWPANIVSATNPNVLADPLSAPAEANLTAALPPCEPEIYTTCPFVKLLPWALKIYKYKSSPTFKSTFPPPKPNCKVPSPLSHCNLASCIREVVLVLKSI